MQENTGFLLIHGFTGSPFEMRPIEKALKEKGFSNIRCPVLPGHCESLIAFEKTRFKDWLRGAEEEFKELSSKCDRIILVGLSMGGSLCLWLAQHFKVSALITISAPIYLYRLFPWEGTSVFLPFIGFLRFVYPVVKTRKVPEKAKKIAPFGGYEGFYALHPLYSLIQGLKEVKKGLAKITAPILVLHSPQDKSVPVSNAWNILLGVNSSLRRLQLLPIQETITTRHLLTTHIETREWVKKYILDFSIQVLTL